jgi:hypothetical protein
VNRSRDETAEESSRGCSVKTMVVIQHAFEHEERGKAYQLA